MNEPRMIKPRDPMKDETQKETEAQKPSKETDSFYPWEEETIVVNGQPMTITFPPDGA